ncbi:MAG: hypothetical protein LBF88_06760 [Planctomycetaceae bacterium]|nr:hypothetical protein [Planctomycetaceae bacterium]
MINLRSVLYGKKQLAVYLIVCVFILPLPAQDSGWNGYQTQGKNNEPSAAISTISTDLDNTSRFYLLRTGFLTEGTATNDGKQYLLKTNFGTMSVPVANVEFVGATREDVYHYKRGTVNGNDCNELIKLAEWCFNNNLMQQGMTEYQRALPIAPNPVFAEVIRKRLETLQDSPTESSGLSGVRTVSASSSNESDDTGIHRWGNGIPKPVVNSFTKKVQPILVSRCAAADCHGSGSENQFKLGIPSHTIGNTTYRNLRSVLQWIDFDYPTESQLLSVLVSYHGGTKAAFSVESTQYNNIVQWVRLTAKELPTEYRSQIDAHKNNVQTDKKESELPLKEETLPPALRNAMMASQPAPKTSQSEIPAARLTPSDSNSIPVGATRTLPSNDALTRLNISGSSSNNSLNLPPTDDSLKDPFDPSIFNLRHHH